MAGPEHHLYSLAAETSHQSLRRSPYYRALRSAVHPGPIEEGVIVFSLTVKTDPLGLRRVDFCRSRALAVEQLPLGTLARL